MLLFISNTKCYMTDTLGIRVSNCCQMITVTSNVASDCNNLHACMVKVTT